MESGGKIPTMIKIKQEVEEVPEASGGTEGYQVFFIKQEVKEEEDSGQDDEVEMQITTGSSSESVGDVSFKNSDEDQGWRLSGDEKEREEMKEQNEREDAHQAALRDRCRLCCTELQDHRPYAIAVVADIIEGALGIDITQDDSSIHPPSLCGGCVKKLKRWKKESSKKAKAVPLSITVHVFKPHNEGCVICTQSRLKSMVTEIAQEYVDLTVQSRSNRLYFVELDNDGNSKKALTIKIDGSWCVRVYGRAVSNEQPEFSKFPCQLCNYEDVKSLLARYARLNVCPGNEHDLSDEALVGKPVYRHLYPDSSTIRHRSCPLLTDAIRCGPCAIYRTTLAAASKVASKPRTSSRHTNYRFLTREEVEDRLRKSCVTVKSLRKRIDRLKSQISEWVQEGQKLPPT